MIEKGKQMKRVTTDTPKTNYETMMNYAYAKDGLAHLRYADGEEDVELCQYINKAALEEEGCNCDIFNDFMDCDCIYSLLYTVATQAAELREYLKYYEDKEEGKTDEKGT